MSQPAGDPRFIRVTLTSLAGPLVWALHFGAVYGGQHVACRIADPGNASLRIAIAGVTAVAILVLVFIFLNVRQLVRPAPPFDQDVPTFLRAVSLSLIGLSLFAIVATALAGLMLPSCPTLR